MYTDPYDELDLLEKRLVKLSIGFKRLNEDVSETQNNWEVESFLESGPGGTDPD